jgi:hypothetical protein
MACSSKIKFPSGMAIGPIARDTTMSPELTARESGWEYVLDLHVTVIAVYAGGLANGYVRCQSVANQSMIPLSMKLFTVPCISSLGPDGFST